MVRRVIFGILGLVISTMAPWWFVVLYGIVGAILFSWYLEAVLGMACFDAIFGYAGLPWYLHIVHTACILIPLLGIEYLKSQLIERPFATSKK